MTDSGVKNRLGTPNCDLHFKSLMRRGGRLSRLSTAIYSLFFGVLAAGMLYFLING